MEEIKEDEEIMFSIVMTTCANEKEATKISDILLKKKLAACTKFNEVRSSYWWKKKITKSDEALLMILTRKKNVKEIMSTIKKIHSYEVPEIIEIPIVKGNKKYLEWVCDVTK